MNFKTEKPEVRFTIFKGQVALGKLYEAKKLKAERTESCCISSYMYHINRVAINIVEVIHSFYIMKTKKPC